MSEGAMEEPGKEHNSYKRLCLAVSGGGGDSAAAWRTNRVARAAAGGKDRHSKVVTSRGLRDRRIRLSVPTAIQFYDIQDRLGVDQPSKAIEWLIRAATAAIDGLPSLDCSFLPSAAASPPHDDAAEVSTSETSKGSVLSLANGPSDSGNAAAHHANAYNGGGASGTFAELLLCSPAADKSMQQQQQQPTLAYYAAPQSSPMSFEMFPQLAFSQEQQHHHHAAVAFDRSTLQSNAVAVPMWQPSQYPFMMQRFSAAPAEASSTFPFFVGGGGSAAAPATSNGSERRLQLWDFKQERKT
ncbi:hypothetical protein QYE76_001061 [Lolium multiflorum]|uniref:TCP domain-containing protein n=1 Tax=Lolium multiflorum TaxID=4521 RepID=A0AAD8VZB8_LOLMU|nr:hypothetical protein QYE76_001061 [Lolium multiflorum]